MFFTLTFPADRAPEVDKAQEAWRALIRRLRYRDLLEEYGFVIQRTKRGTPHWHGIGHFRFMSDGLAEWRELLNKSGFGVQNRLVIAKPTHAGYVTRYISKGLAELPGKHRAYGFSRGFPHGEGERIRRDQAAALELLGVQSQCSWMPTAAFAAMLR